MGIFGSKATPPTVDPSVDSSYSPPLGPAVGSNPKVFFDISVGGSPLGRVTMELKVSHPVLSLRPAGRGIGLRPRCTAP